MKKILILLAAILLSAPVVSAGEIYSPCGTFSDSAVVASGPGVIGGVIITTDGSNTTTIQVFDGSNSSGGKLTPALPVTTSATDRVRSVSLDAQFNDGLYISASGGAFSYTVYCKTR
jgi:hypothetical protein